MKPKSTLPAVRAASACLKPKRPLPPGRTPRLPAIWRETQMHRCRQRRGPRPTYHVKPRRQLPLVRATIDTLIEVGRRNDFAIRQRMRIRQATLSHIARSEFGYHTHLSEAERKKHDGCRNQACESHTCWRGASPEHARARHRCCRGPVGRDPEPSRKGNGQARAQAAGL